jgi:hypothetical protein
MSERSFLTADAARTAVCTELDVIDAALDRIRETSTELVGNAFRIEVATRLEDQHRVNRGLSYRMLAELFDPPDGQEDPDMPTERRVRDRLRQRWRITQAELRRRVKFAARIRGRRTLTGQPLPPELPVLAKAVERGEVGEDHIREICKALDVLPNSVSAADKDADARPHPDGQRPAPLPRGLRRPFEPAAVTRAEHAHRNRRSARDLLRA